MKTILILLIAMAVGLAAGCATLRNAQSPNSVTPAQAAGEIAEQGAVQYLTIDQIQKLAKSSPDQAAEVAKQAHELIAFTKDLVTTGISFDALRAKVTAKIATQHYDAKTLVAINTLRNGVDIYFQDLKSAPDIATGALSPAGVATLLKTLRSIDEALVLAGY